jgi:hypothetical protein
MLARETTPQMLAREALEAEAVSYQECYQESRQIEPRAEGTP